MFNYEDVIVIDSESDDDIDELRKLAIISMKHEKKEPIVENFVQECYSKFDDYKLNYSFLPKREKLCSEFSNENSKKIKIEVVEPVKEVSVDGNALLKVCRIDSILNLDDCIETQNLLKEEELKNKLLKALKDKKQFNQVKELIPTSEFLVNEEPYDNTLSDSADDDFNIYTSSLLPPEVITDPIILKYHNLISKVKSDMDDLVKSMQSMSSSIQNNLKTSKKISTQIENLKIQKVELHKEICVNRRKILDLNKIKKQKSLELTKYEQIKRNLSLKRIPIHRNRDLVYSSSPVSCETDFKTNIYDIDCNHVICPAWLNSSCVNKLCIYQHPKFLSKPIKRTGVKIKENDKVFLKEMNPSGFICKLSCDACLINIPLSTLHLNDDWYCRSCCQKLITLTKPTEILHQLILIWHHIYKRYIMSKNLPPENRDSSILQNLHKCSEAMKSKLLTTTNLPLDILNSVGCHVILNLNQQCRIDELLNFIKALDFEFDLIKFACNLSSPVPKLYQLLIDSIEFHINQSIRKSFNLLIKQFSVMSKSLGKSIIDQLFEWLKLCIRLKKIDCYHSKIYDLTCTVFEEIFGSNFQPRLSLSMNDIRLGDKYWIDRKDDIFRLAKLYSSSEILSPTNPVDFPYCSWMDMTIHLLLIKFMIIAYFFTGNEDGALQICERYTTRNYFFEILLSELSLNYNSPISINGHHDRTAFLLEHTYNKSDWLLNNRSRRSCVKLLESVPQILYKINQSIQSTNETLKFYESFLGIGSMILDNQVVILIPKFSDSEMKSIRNNCSAIWLCYISLSVLSNNSIDFTTILKSDQLNSMPQNHLNRVAQFIVFQLGKLFFGSVYNSNLQTVVLLMKNSMEFVNFIDLVHCINFDKLLDCQLALWLFLIDFCTLKFSRDNFDQFLVIISEKLLDSFRTHSNSCHQVFHHIVMCYPVRHVVVWLNFIQLLLDMDNVPIYEFIDACEMALNEFSSSKLLWQHYYSSAIRSGDQELAKKIKLDASRFGFELR